MKQAHLKLSAFWGVMIIPCAIFASCSVKAPTNYSIIRGIFLSTKGVPLDDVQIMAEGANVKYSDENGLFLLKFLPEYMPGRLIKVSIKKKGWVLLESKDSELVLMAPNEPGLVTIIMCETKYQVSQKENGLLLKRTLDKSLANWSDNIQQNFKTEMKLIRQTFDSTYSIHQKKIEQVLDSLSFIVKRLTPKDTVITPFDMYVLGKKALKEKNETEALKWWYKSAEAGCVDAQDRLAAYLYQRREHLNADCKEILTWLDKGRQNGSLRSLTILATIFFEGACVIKDNSKSEAFLLEAVNSGYRKAYYNLGVIYDHTGKYDQAFTCYSEAAQDEYIAAYYGLGWLYYTGKGKLKKDKDLGEKLIRQAAELGYSPAINDVNEIFEK